MSDVPVLLRPMVADDVAAAHGLSASIGWPHRLEDWRMMLELGSGIAGCTPDGRLGATALRWQHTPTIATLGMILVDPALQRLGLGRRLMEALLAGSDGALRLYSTEAGRGLYSALGFRATGLARQLQGSCLGPVASPRVRLASRSEHAVIRALDAQAFGAPRPRLIETLLAVGAALVIETQGVMTGFAIRRPFGHGVVIGPVVATSQAEALELTAAAIVPGFNRVDVAVDRPEVREVLARLGFGDAGAAIPMARGDGPATSGRPIYFALASQAFG